MIDITSKNKIAILAILLAASTFLTGVKAQDGSIDKQKFVFFPAAPKDKWVTSVGLTATTMPYDITEEFHYRVPAVDLHVLKKVNNRLSLDGRVSFQVLQNLFTLGPRWTTRLNNRFYMGVGNDLGYWFGFVNFAGFKSKASGWQNSPNFSIGYRFNKQVLLTVRAEALMNFNIRTYADNSRVTTDYRFLSGSTYTVAVEQPFYGNKSLTLGFRAMYTDFFWQTWPAFESFDRNIFFPQLIIGLIL